MGTPPPPIIEKLKNFQGGRGKGGEKIKRFTIISLSHQSGAASLGTGNDQADCDLIRAFLSYILKRWGKELNAREESVKRSARGRMQAGMHKQTVEHISTLMRSLEKYTVNNDIRLHLTNITKWVILMI